MAASCCGAGFTIPSIITSDDKAQIAGIYTHSKVDTDVSVDGKWRKRNEDDRTDIFKLEGAHIIDDRWQTGLSIPFQKRTRSGSNANTSDGFGDITSQIGYEYLPDWNYNPYRPKGIGYMSLIFPTGRSIYESKDGSGIDSRGRGFWGVGMGTILTKTWTYLDANLNMEIHQSFQKQVDNQNVKGTIQPGKGGSLAIGSGFNWHDMRLGGLINWVYEEGINVKGTPSSQGHFTRYANGTVVFSYLLPNNSTISVSYTDQTQFGSPLNSSLSKSVTLFFQKRWER
ncbi:MAG: hypothetical protein ACOYL6_08305 [Bacteriovoracaceae bacterium]